MKKKALIFQNSKGDGPGIFSGFLEAKGWHRRIVHLYGGESIPADWSRYDFLMIMGGPMGVYDDRKHPYLADEVNVIRRALEQSKPVIGLCLGAQLMSRALGARVVKAPRQEIGWYPIEMTAEGARDPLLASFSSNPVLFLWHEDGFLLPKGAVRVAGTRECPNQAMRIGTMSYGFQFHFEVTRDVVAYWLNAGKYEVKSVRGPEGQRIVLEETDKYIAGSIGLAETFFGAYLASIRK